jgi:UDP-N-acetylglucosamine 1-carboxyvinyltransferase
MKFKIKGGKPLIGEITLAGAKNAATKMMITSLLSEDSLVLENFPKIGDTEITAELCGKVGTEIVWGEGKVSLHTPVIKQNKVTELSRKNRLPILALGPLLARAGEAEVPILGGDKIGPRPVDLHVYALKALGAEIEATSTSYKGWTKNGLIGASIKFPFISVGATENAILAAVLAKGKTKISNAALEPEVVDIIKLLQKMGAIIELGGSRTIFIEGVVKLHGATHKVLPDRNEAVSFACLALGTNGKILVKGAEAQTAYGRNRRAPGLHDRLAAAAFGSSHSSERNFQYPRNYLRRPIRLRPGLEQHGREGFRFYGLRGIHSLPFCRSEF